MTKPLEAYQANRQSLLTEIVQTLSSDERFVAAWLTGSFGRHEADSVSDLDLSVVVSDSYSADLCAHLAAVTAQPAPQRLELFSKFGELAIVHENNRNAPEGGAFTFVMYHPSAVMVDWVLRPHQTARRPADSLLLFEKVGIPLAPPPELGSLETRANNASEIIAFFWMMMAITIKYFIRGDAVFVTKWLEELHQLMQEVERLVAGQAQHYHRGSLSKQGVTPAGQLSKIHTLCQRMLQLMPEVEKMGGYVRSSPMAMIETLLSFYQPSSMAQS